MIKHLRDLWILKDCGIILFSRVKDHETDDQCLGGLTSALYYFAHKGLHEKLQRFTTDKFEYKLVEKEDLLFFGTFPPKVRDKPALRELLFIADRFTKKYPKEIFEQWDHNINMFIDFEREVKPRNEIIGDCIDRLWDHSKKFACSNH